METLYRSIRKIKIGGTSSILRVKTDGEVLCVTISAEAGTVFGDSPRVSVSVGYNGDVLDFPDTPLPIEAIFASSSAREVVLGGDLSVEGKGCESFSFAWDGAAGSVRPGVSFSFDRIKELYSSTLSFTVTGAEGMFVKPISISCTYKNSGGVERSRRYEASSAGDVFSCTNSMSDILAGAGNRVCYRIEVACYADEASADEEFGERFLGIADVVTPEFIISSSHAQSVPFDIAYLSPTAGARLRISWRAHADASTFTLQRSIDGGEYAEVYSGGEKSYIDTVPRDATTVAYRVSAASSAWWSGEVLGIRVSNLYIGTPYGIRAVGGMYVGGDDGEIKEIAPVMSVGGM